MTNPIIVRAACVAAALSVSLFARADSFTSSVSSAGSASSGNVSGPLRGSSNRSTGGDKATAADHRIIEIAKAPDRAGIARITMQADSPDTAEPDTGDIKLLLVEGNNEDTVTSEITSSP